ncbi:MAG: MBL fold metallo-hydrolase [Hominenteromicrobium sp.]
MLKKLTDRIFYLPHESETDRPALYYILGSRYSLAVDAGNSDAHRRKFYDALAEARLRAPDFTAVTHWHWDHTFALHSIPGVTIASAKTNEKLRAVQNWEWTEEAMAAREQAGEDIAFCSACIRLEYPALSEIRVVPAAVSVFDRMEIDLGGVTCVLEHRDSAHSRDALFIYVPEERALALGDADCEDHYENGGQYDPQRLRDLLAYLEALDYTHALLGHDAPCTKAEQLGYLRGELRAIQQIQNS